MREAQFPKNGYIFRHKVNTDTFARELYLAEGESIDDWAEITDGEYDAIIAEQEYAIAEMGM